MLRKTQYIYIEQFTKICTKYLFIIFIFIQYWSFMFHESDMRHPRMMPPPMWNNFFATESAVVAAPV